MKIMLRIWGNSLKNLSSLSRFSVVRVFDKFIRSTFPPIISLLVCLWTGLNFWRADSERFSHISISACMLSATGIRPSCAFISSSVKSPYWRYPNRVCCIFAVVLKVWKIIIEKFNQNTQKYLNTFEKLTSWGFGVLGFWGFVCCSGLYLALLGRP